MTDHADRAHSRLSASGSHRWMECSGSVRMEEPFPDETSPHAAEGTAAHELFEAILRNDGQVPDDALYAPHAAGYDTGEMVKNLREGVDYVRNQEGAKFYEERVSLEALDPPCDMFGTVDVAIWNAGTGVLEILDLKYGQGVVVDPVENSQLMYYALGMILRLRVRPEIIRVTVFQPRAGEPAIRSWEFDWERLKQFKTDLLDRANATLDPEAPLAVGDHCRWCKAKAVCPAQHQFALEVAQVEFDVADREPAMPAVEGLTADQIGLILERAKLVEDWLKAVREYAHSAIEAGGEVPGWKLVAGRRSRSWVDEAAAEAWLRQRFKVGEILPRKLVSPAQAEKLVKDRARLEIPEEMILVSDGAPKLAPADSPKPALNSGAEFNVLENPNE